MSFIKPLEDLIHKLDPEAAQELADVKADFETRLAQVKPALDKLASDVETAVTDAAEAAAPGLKASLTTILTAAETELKSILGL